MNETLKKITKRVIKRSTNSRKCYLERIKEYKLKGKALNSLGCSNIAHAIAPLSSKEKDSILNKNYNMAIVTAYNDMLSAHEPYATYPSLIKQTLLANNATAQVAGGVPAMCDGITQSQPGMELSLFSRDNIAMGTAIALSHNVYDGAIYLGVCDKIVPGLLIGGLSFGHLPSIFLPAGPMTSGVLNKQKAQVREEFAKGKVSSKALLEVECKSYHNSGTCTFYGTANSNQMLLEMMGLQLANSSFVNANTALRKALTIRGVEQLLALAKQQITLSDILCEKSFINAIIGLLATGGSSNHTIHLIAIAKAAGIILTWDDFDELSKIIPLLCKLYPNGNADVNHFRDAGGMSVVISQLLKKGLLHNDVQTIMGKGLDKYIVSPKLEKQGVKFVKGLKQSNDVNIISSIDKPFSSEGGLKLLKGNIGRAVIKTSALKKEHFYIKEEAIVFDSQEQLQKAFYNKQLEKDFIAVVRFQGPKANGMPELHGLMTPLGVLQNLGFKVAVITDGRMSGASGKVPSAIHTSPEASNNGVLSKIKTGDVIELDIHNGKMNLLLKKSEILNREAKELVENNKYGFGRELFANIRSNISSSEEGASIFSLTGEKKA